MFATPPATMVARSRNHFTPPRFQNIDRMPTSLLRQGPSPTTHQVSLFGRDGSPGVPCHLRDSIPYDDSEGDLFILTNSPMKVPRAVHDGPTAAPASAVLLEYWLQPSHFHGVNQVTGNQFTNGDIINQGIGYANYIGNLRYYREIQGTNWFTTHLTVSQHRRQKWGAMALIAYVCAYGWNTGITQFRSLEWMRDNPPAGREVEYAQRHQLIVLPLLHFFMRCMDPQHDLNLQKMLTVKLQNYITMNREKMTVGGVWTLRALRDHVNAGPPLNRGDGGSLVQGPRLNIARLIYHLAPRRDDPQFPIVHPTNGCCNLAERLSVTQPFSNDLAIRR